MTWQEYIEPALAHQATHTLADVEHLVSEGLAQVWQGERSAAVTEIIQQPRQKDFSLWLCGGDMEEICETMLPKAAEWAKKEGCTRMLTSGRTGWDRVMKKYGFEPVARICARDLT